jgi:hypothetical protein
VTINFNYGHTIEIFGGKYPDFPILDIYKCPISENQKNFPTKKMNIYTTRGGNFISSFFSVRLHFCR